MHNMTRQTKAYAFALTTIAFWSTIASASKLTLNHINPAQLVFYSSVVSTLVLFMVLIIQKKLGQIKELKKKRMVNINWVWPFKSICLLPGTF